MPPEITSIVLEKAAGQGITTLMLVAGIYIVAKLLQKTTHDRIDDLKQRIVVVEAYSRECEEDRRKLWEELAHPSPRV